MFCYRIATFFSSFLTGKMPIFPLKPLLFGTKNICSIAFRYKWYQKTAIPCGLAAKKSYILRYYVNKKTVQSRRARGSGFGYIPPKTPPLL